MLSIHGNYKDLEYEIVSTNHGTDYIIYDFGKVTGERIKVKSADISALSSDNIQDSINDAEENVKEEIDKILSELNAWFIPDFII